MKQQALAILGSTGSIGKQALEIVREHPERFNVVALSCNRNWELLADQIKEFTPEKALICDKTYFSDLQRELQGISTELLAGSGQLKDLASYAAADTVLNGLVGFAGFEPTISALKAGKKVALANKESLVIGGAMINELIKTSRDRLVPVDSEHSAMLQCLVGESNETISKLIITASGGPFRTWNKKKMKDITVSDALNHPNWSMGSKITIDSATMMNKGLEVIEAKWMFDLPLSKIEAVVHPQSVIHSVVEFIDGSSKAQMGPPTMKVPILYALTYPERIELNAPLLDWKQAFELNFEPVDYEKFPCMALAMDALKAGGCAPAVLNAANEIAVERFLNEEISYFQIPQIIEGCLKRLSGEQSLSIDTLTQVDHEARILASTL